MQNLGPHPKPTASESALLPRSPGDSYAVYSLWKCRYITFATVTVTWKKKKSWAMCFPWRGCHIRHSPVPEWWGSLTHYPVSWGIAVTRMKWSIWLPCEMCHLARVAEIETSVCFPTILWTLALKWHFFFLVWNVVSSCSGLTALLWKYERGKYQIGADNKNQQIIHLSRVLAGPCTWGTWF